MHADGTDSICKEIDAFLRKCQRSSGMRAYWNAHPYISTVEIDMLASLCDGPSCVKTIAGRLEQDAGRTQQLLDALTGVGLVERRGETYAATDATILYCRMFAGSR